ncbi:ferredoxin family protein [Candidatus Bathyarchaeota archaeon]|nr:ferredoxin family protein [Candidatus Bathyarchaeota archaeon]
MAVIKIDYKLCTGCKACYDECPLDVFGWNEEEDKPIILYPSECWYCGACEIDCPTKAVDVSQSIAQW